MTFFSSTRPSTLLQVRLPTVDPGVAINWTYWPFMDELKDAIGGTGAAALVLLVGAVIVAAVVWVFARITGAGRVQSVSGVVFLVCAAGAVLIGGASGLIGWFSDLDLGF